MTSSDEQALGVFETKILLKIYEPFCEEERRMARGDWRIRWNQKLYDICDDIDVVKRMKTASSSTRMDSSNPVPKVFESETGGGSRRKVRPCQCWVKQPNENVKRFVSDIGAKLQWQYGVAN